MSPLVAFFLSENNLQKVMHHIQHSNKIHGAYFVASIYSINFNILLIAKYTQCHLRGTVI